MQSYSEERATVVKWNAVGVTTGVGADKAAGPVTFVLSTDEVDRHGDVVSADGWRLEAYRENPVLLWAHDYQHPAIGRAVSVWTEPHRLLAKVEFAPSAFAQEVATLYAAGFQWGVSVGFRPIRWEERRDSPAHRGAGGAALPGAGAAGGERSAGARQPQRVEAWGGGRPHPNPLPEGEGIFGGAAGGTAEALSESGWDLLGLDLS